MNKIRPSIISRRHGEGRVIGCYGVGTRYLNQNATVFYLRVRSGTTDDSKADFLRTKMSRRDGAKLCACLLALCPFAEL